LILNPDYNYVEFHTHSRGTIETFGQYYARSFSKGDLKVIEDKLKRSRDYVSMLVIPRRQKYYMGRITRIWLQ